MTDLAEESWPHCAFNLRSGANNQEHMQRATRYFRLALRYALAGSEPLLLVVMGRVASGKSTLARQLARELDRPVFSSDEIRKGLAALPATQRTPPDLRSQIYSDEMTNATYERLLKGGLAAVCHQGGAILDATFSRKTQREALTSQCEKAGVVCQIIELQTSERQIIERLKRRDQSAGEVSDARIDDFTKLTAAYEAPQEIDPLITVSANTDVSQTVKAAMLRLAKYRSGAITF
jgi:uncharacterized protein